MTTFMRVSALALAIGCLTVPAMAEAAKPVAKHGTTTTKKKVVKRTTVKRRTVVATRTRRKPAILPPNPVYVARAPAPNGQTGTAADLVGHAGDPAVTQRGQYIQNNSPTANAASAPVPTAPRPTPRRF